MTSKTFAVVAGGGTAGHVVPALAVAEALVARGRAAAEIHYVGAQRGVETEMLPETPFPHTFFDVDGLQRSLRGDGLRRNLAFGPRMARSARASTALLRTLRPKVVVSVGGYASLPPVLAARRLRIPVVVVSYDRTPGRASRLAARWATASAVAFDGSPLPRATVTGAPVRQRILDVDRATDRQAARRALGIPDDRFVIGVMGGSLGSGVLNAAIRDFVDRCADDDRLAVRHVAGHRFAEEVSPSSEETIGRDVIHQVVGFEDDMAAMYAAVDLLVGRGGASTVHEIAATGTPAVLVPWADAADDHQTDNVAWLAEVGGAVLVAESDVAGIGREIDRLRHDDEAREALGRAAAGRGEAHRSGALATLIERVAIASGSE
ncbi:MAG: UDP-N-acetylglucosamine--N-acetylmuramyl-(pentapeptide) pyrophosphoryl-undecaprenol N-acetylglucosamine transferase [Actinomycetota bacterium]